MDPETQQAISNSIYSGVVSAYYGGVAVRDWFVSIPGIQKFIVVATISGIILLVLYSIYSNFKRRAQLRFDQVPSFITDLTNLPNTKLPFTYTDVNGQSYPYLPSKFFPTENNKQFTWSFWLYVNGFDPVGGKNNDWGTYMFGEYKHIMSRGQPNTTNTPTSYQYPGFWLKPTENTLACLLSTVDGKRVELDLPNIQMNTWFNVILVLNESNLLLYIDGELVHSKAIPSSPQFHNNQNVYITNNGGFAGELYNFQYFNEALEPPQIRLIYDAQRRSIDDHIRGLDYKANANQPANTQNLSRSRNSDQTKDSNVHKEPSNSWF